MRSALLAATALLILAGCRGADATQANNSMSNISSDQRSPDATAVGSDLSTSTTPVSAEEAKKVMHERHEGMEAIGKSTKSIKRELDGSTPDLAVLRTNAGRINDLAQKAAHWFPTGTGPDAGKTGAKAEIWQDPQDFGTKLGGFQKAAQDFNSAASGNDAGAIKTAFGRLGQSCKACHDKYRKEMKH
jgi:cytochrome c556